MPDLTPNGKGPGPGKQSVSIADLLEVSTVDVDKMVIPLTPDQRQSWFT
ncbi:hypothetical protein [Paenibacillus polymyxa]|nr:hypothetical protein [Paenibacillus polymyxa]WDM24221.1 hypothetical protein J4I02_12505 [Paenibacillus polymyxa]